MHHGSKELRQRVGGPCARGEAVISLAITEPWAGSDVAALKTSAVKSECGKYYIVSGMKKWITAGTNADYLTTAVVTDADAGMLGVSLIVVETKTPGVSIRSMKV
jgi:alkylation response protein AidB-like acyl-CoA dehydrogenase